MGLEVLEEVGRAGVDIEVMVAFESSPLWPASTIHPCFIGCRTSPMNISVFDLFKIGVGPSSSHTMGPMKAAGLFLSELDGCGLLEKGLLEKGLLKTGLSKTGSPDKPLGVRIELFGSLSASGRGHGTDKAVLVGLMGEQAESIDPGLMERVIDEVTAAGRLNLAGIREIPFNLRDDLKFVDEVLDYHPNGMKFFASVAGVDLLERTYYSIGGGFVTAGICSEKTAGKTAEKATPAEESVTLPYEFESAAELLGLCAEHGLRVSDLMRANERAWRLDDEIEQGLTRIWEAMDACMERGMSQKGTLPGGLNVRRRAASLRSELASEQTAQQANLISTSFGALDWVNLYALAINEENAAGGRIVTAPTNGAAGIIPAVLKFYLRFSHHVGTADVSNFLLTAAAIGILCKKNASISGAEVGCQGEVGSACAMAAAGLAEVMGGAPAQVEHAAEIALEHNLGLTCDPVGGLVQIPCIERNAIAAVKAINAAQLALRGDGSHRVSLDEVIRTMRQTGEDMMEKYKETSRGGLAVNVVEC